ncbi:MAG: 4-hydroxy-tetrahydrodipicolinate synthase [Anaerolineales bacterium]|nr:4-hydroxy-tetrahydrodipicolinate synthase [Anaerolineales bacterium]
MLSGIIPALLTPFTPDDQVDVAAIRELVEYLLSHGVDGFYLCGSTGEGPLLSEKERQLVAETAIDQVGDRAPIIVHVGSIATNTAVNLAQHARETGAFAVASVPPFYYSVGREGIEEHYRHISQAAKIPLYVYNIPATTNINVSAETISNLAKEGVFQGLKYTSYDQLGFREIIEKCGPDFNVFAGPDEMLLPFLVMGAHGGIGTTYNCMPDLFVELFKSWQANDLNKAQSIQYQIDRIILALVEFGIIPSVKIMMKARGIGCGRPRLPLVGLKPDQEERLFAKLSEVGFE